MLCFLSLLLMKYTCTHVDRKEKFRINKIESILIIYVSVATCRPISFILNSLTWGTDFKFHACMIFLLIFIFMQGTLRFFFRTGKYINSEKYIVAFQIYWYLNQPELCCYMWFKPLLHKRQISLPWPHAVIFRGTASIIKMSVILKAIVIERGAVVQLGNINMLQKTYFTNHYLNRVPYSYSASKHTKFLQKCYKHKVKWTKDCKIKQEKDADHFPCNRLIIQIDHNDWQWFV